jgi:hypothetical protein
MDKQKDKGGLKDVFLIGKDEDGIRYWLESPSWDCGWYWGFGYIETYESNRLPSKARDISSHQHADNFMSEFFTGCNGSEPILKETTFTEAEGWELSELFQQFYHLREQAEFYKNGKSNVADTAIKNWANPELVKKINEEMIPVVTGRIIEILSPEL